MEQKQLDAIKERVANASMGPWMFDKGSTERGDRRPAVITHFCKDGDEYIHGDIAEMADAEFIAHARQDVPALLAEVERLQKRLAQTEKCYEIMEKAAFKANDKIICFKKALEFYANEDNHECQCKGYTSDNTYLYTKSIVGEDYGERARQALGGESHD